MYKTSSISYWARRKVKSGMEAEEVLLRVETVIKQRAGPEENDKGSVSEGLEKGTYNTY